LKRTIFPIVPREGGEATGELGPPDYSGNEFVSGLDIPFTRERPGDAPFYAKYALQKERSLSGLEKTLRTRETYEKLQ